jgi:hypothetical protein
MKGNLGSEVHPGAKTLSEDTFGTTNSLRAPTYTWSAKRHQHVALRHTRTWGIMKGGQGCHHLPPTLEPWDKMKVTYSLDTMSMLTVTTLALARNFHLYQESSTRAPINRRTTNTQVSSNNDNLT